MIIIPEVDLAAGRLIHTAASRLLTVDRASRSTRWQRRHFCDTPLRDKQMDGTSFRDNQNKEYEPNSYSAASERSWTGFPCLFSTLPIGAIVTEAVRHRRSNRSPKPSWTASHQVHYGRLDRWLDRCSLTWCRRLSNLTQTVSMNAGNVGRF